MPWIITQMVKTTGRETAVPSRLNRKKQPKKISSSALSIRVPLLGMKACVRRVKISFAQPAKRVRQPRTHAAETKVISGFAMQRIPRITRRTPATQSQILVLVFIQIIALVMGCVTNIMIIVVFCK